MTAQMMPIASASPNNIPELLPVQWTRCRTLAWVADNPAVATVSTSGVVAALGAGSATISATSENQSGTAILTVVLAPVTSVTVTLAKATVAVSGTTQPTAVTKHAQGNVVTGRLVTWASTNTAVATVSSSGLVTAVGPGSSSITGTSENQTGSRH